MYERDCLLALTGVLVLGFGCGSVGEGASIGATGQPLALERLEAESGAVTGAGNAAQGPAAPDGWVLFQNTGSVCWAGVDVRDVTAFELHYGQPESTAETFRVRFGAQVQGAVELEKAGDWQRLTGRVTGRAAGGGAQVAVCVEAITDREAWVASIDRLVLLGDGAAAPDGGTAPTPPDAPRRLEAETHAGMAGVLFERTSDAGGGLNAGWIDPGDYIEWRVDDLVGGTYEVVTRSATTRTASYRILVDGAEVATSAIPNTGGWQSWRSFSTPSFRIGDGSHSVRIEFTSDGQNLNWLALAPAAAVGAGPCAATRGVTTVDYELCVDGREFIVKGTAYDPQHEPTCSSIPFYEASAFDDLWLAGDAAAIAGMNANAIRVYSALSKVIASGDCKPDGRCWITDRHLDALHAAGLKVVLSIGSIWDFREAQHIDFAARYMDHPAVLAAQLGNEMNFNSLYEWNGRSPSELVALANGWADEARAAGWSKPIILGWGQPGAADRAALRGSNADIIAYQIYQGLDFGLDNGQSVFDWHRATFDGASSARRPSLVTEYGADAIRGGPGWGAEDEAAQAYANAALTRAIRDDALSGPAGTAGGIVFTWSDNWGKSLAAFGGGDPCAHEIGGVTALQGSGPYPDWTFHEKWWGQVRRDRSKRDSYHELRAVYGSY